MSQESIRTVEITAWPRLLYQCDWASKCKCLFYFIFIAFCVKKCVGAQNKACDHKLFSFIYSLSRKRAKRSCIRVCVCMCVYTVIYRWSNKQVNKPLKRWQQAADSQPAADSGATSGRHNKWPRHRWVPINNSTWGAEWENVYLRV